MIGDKTTVGKVFDFHASHHDALADDKCNRVHGHTYELELTISGALRTERGMLLHGDALKEFYREEVEPYVEHQDLNKTLHPLNPTMENVANWVCEKMCVHFRPVRNIHYVEVKLWETRTMYAHVQARCF